MTHSCTPANVRATAMIEMVLALPIIFITLSLLFFAGRGVVRVQHALVMDRHDAWLKAAHLSTDTPTNIHVMLRSYRHSDATLRVGPSQGNEQLDEAFMGSRSEIENLERSYVDGIDLAYDSFVDSSRLTGDALRTFQTMTDISHTVQTSLRTEFDVDSTPLWRDMAGDIQHGHRRDDTTWSFTRGYTQFRVERGDFILMESADQPYGNTPRLLHVADTIGNEYYIRTADLVTLEPGYRYDMWQPRPGAILDPTRGTTAVDLEVLYTRLDSLPSNGLANAINGVYRGHSPYHYAGPTPYWFGPDIAHRSYGNRWRAY
tara:strand:+ start:12358 stop:13308 length:951 start_codon:yes stop_codon:yes gene_type:complete